MFKPARSGKGSVSKHASLDEARRKALLKRQAARARKRVDSLGQNVGLRVEPKAPALGKTPGPAAQRRVRFIPNQDT
jgi:hypothetical protein